MLNYTPVMGAIVAALLTALPAHANTSEAELQQLRSQVQELRQQYEQRLQALEARLNQAQQATATPGTVPAAAATTTQAATATFPSATRKGNSAFNPAIGMILTGTYANLSKGPENWELSGFNLGGDGHGVGPGKRGFSLGESEITFSANVDNLAYGALTLGLDGDNEVEVEEAFVQSTALPYGLTLKGGRFYGALGYQNEQHAHTWSFVDLPLAHQAFLGGQYKQEGAQLKWVLPTTQYVELGAELGNGSAFPGSDRGGNGLGATLLSARTGGDVGDSHSWRLGASWLRTQAQERAWGLAHDHGHEGEADHEEASFTGTSRLWVLDGVWKWAPNGNAKRTNLTLQGEYFWREDAGTASVPHNDHAHEDTYRSRQSGWYVQGVYQFMPQWRVGLRHDRLSSGSLRLGDGIATHYAAHEMAEPGYNPKRTSLMLDWSPSEFQRWRIQLNSDQARQGVKDTQFYLQYQMSLGAHGAHAF
ncbi:hypothetical protein [Aquabacterium sp.]|uniref:hypothetical protein n=1 Tax=Aquabacterium sp. TaxID=1872578 RepID=UPI003BB0CB2E